MSRRIRNIMLLEAAAFLAAALVHAGVLASGYEHREARIAETVIGVVLLAGAAAAWMRPRLARRAGLAAQGFALLGTLVGITTIAIGIGPRTVADVIYHVAIVIVLVWGLLVASRTPRDARLPA